MVSHVLDVVSSNTSVDCRLNNNAPDRDDISAQLEVAGQDAPLAHSIMLVARRFCNKTWAHVRTGYGGDSLLL